MMIANESDLHKFEEIQLQMKRKLFELNSFCGGGGGQSVQVPFFEKFGEGTNYKIDQTTTDYDILTQSS